MSNWYNEAQRRLEQKQQQEEQQRLQALRQQEQLYVELLEIVYATGALKKLEHIKQYKWGCGQIHSYPRKVEPIEWIADTWTNRKAIIDGYSEAGLQLHFEIEVLKFVVDDSASAGDERGSSIKPPIVRLLRSTKSIVLEISAVQNEPNGSRQLWFAGKPLSAPLSNFAALVQELDEAIYQYCQPGRSPLPLEEKEAQDRINKLEEEKYRKYIHPRRKWIEWSV